jgi:hypothetical protein
VAFILAGAALGLAGAGCSSAPVPRDEQVRLLMEKSARLQEELHQSQQQVADLSAAGRTPPTVQPVPEDPFRPVSIQISALSGVVDRGAGPARERLRILFEPLDATDDVVKRAGSLELEALEPGAKDKPPLYYQKWAFSLDELAQTWVSGLGTYAYVLRLQWPGGKPPSTPTLLVRAKFRTLDGRVLTTETEVNVAPPAVPAPVAAPAAPAKPSAPVGSPGAK